MMLADRVLVFVAMNSWSRYRSVPWLHGLLVVLPGYDRFRALIGTRRSPAGEGPCGEERKRELNRRLLRTRVLIPPAPPSMPKHMGAVRPSNLSVSASTHGPWPLFLSSRASAHSADMLATTCRFAANTTKHVGPVSEKVEDLLALCTNSTDTYMQLDLLWPLFVRRIVWKRRPHAP